MRSREIRLPRFHFKSSASYFSYSSLSLFDIRLCSLSISSLNTDSVPLTPFNSALPLPRRVITALTIISPTFEKKKALAMTNYITAPLPISETLEITAAFLECLLATNNAIVVNSKHHSTNDLASVFHARSVPDISVEKYIQRMAKYSPFPAECLITALIYFERIKSSYPSLIVSSFNIHRLLLTSILLSAKFHCDNLYTNSHYAKVGGVSNRELKSLEFAMLDMLEFRIDVSLDELSTYALDLDMKFGRNSSPFSTPLLESNVPSLTSSPAQSFWRTPPPPPPFVRAYPTPPTHANHKFFSAEMPSIATMDPRLRHNLSTSPRHHLMSTPSTQSTPPSSSLRYLAGSNNHYANLSTPIPRRPVNMEFSNDVLIDIKHPRKIRHQTITSHKSPLLRASSVPNQVSTQHSTKVSDLKSIINDDMSRAVQDHLHLHQHSDLMCATGDKRGRSMSKLSESDWQFP